MITSSRKAADSTMSDQTRSRSNPCMISMKPSVFTAPGTGTLIWK